MNISASEIIDQKVTGNSEGLSPLIPVNYPTTVWQKGSIVSSKVWPKKIELTNLLIKMQILIILLVSFRIYWSTLCIKRWKNNLPQHVMVNQGKNILRGPCGNGFVTQSKPNFLDHVWSSNQAHFLLPGHVNRKYDYLGGGTVIPEVVIQRPLPSTKCTAWVAVCKNGIIGSYWFEDGNEKSQTAHTERCVVILRTFSVSL